MLADQPAEVPAERRVPKALSSLAVPYYPRVFLSGWLWNVTRWMGVFLGSYIVNLETGSPFLVQLVGAAFAQKMQEFPR